MCYLIHLSKFIVICRGQDIDVSFIKQSHACKISSEQENSNQKVKRENKNSHGDKYNKVKKIRWGSNAKGKMIYVKTVKYVGSTKQL